MKYPNTIDRNIYLAYIHKENITATRRNENQLQNHQNHQQILDAINLNWDLNYPESLVELCVKIIAENWSSKFNELIYVIMRFKKNILKKLNLQF